MKNLKLLRYGILSLIALSIFFVFFSFKKESSIKLPEEKHKPVKAQMVIENGENVLYSEGEEVAKLIYEKAVQKDNGLFMSQVEIKWKNGAVISTEKAKYFNSRVLFETETKGKIPEENLSIIFYPESIFENNVLTGSNYVNCFFEGGKLKGKRFKFDFSDYTLVANKNVSFESAEVNLNSQKTVINFKKRIFRFFGKTDFEFKGKNLKGRCDYAKYLPEKNSFYLYGKCTVETEDGSFNFSEGKIKILEKEESLECKGIFSFFLPGYKGEGKGLVFEKDTGYCDYLRTDYSSFNISTINCRFEKGEADSKITGENPYIVDTAYGRILKGEKVVLEKGLLKVVSPVFRDENMFAVSDVCLLNSKKKNTVIFPGKVWGGFDNFAFTGKRADIGKNETLLYNAYLNSLENPDDYFKADKVMLYRDYLKGVGNVEFNTENEKRKNSKIFSDFITYLFSEGSARLEGNVKMLSDRLKVFPEKALIFKKFAILFKCKFEVESKYSGVAQIAVINFDTRYSYLYNARVKDSSGNILKKGGKLTLDNRTDRIFVEKAGKKEQVEVKIKL